MIQFNLLPDVKLDYIKAQRSRRLVVVVSVVVSLASVALLILLLSVSALQNRHLSDLSTDITNKSATLQGKPDINTILTVQNQLERLTELHNGKPATTRLFADFNNLTPATVSISSLDIKYIDDTITVTGTSDALSSVNKYVDTLKLTTYTADSASTPTTAFSNVVLSSFALNSSSKDATQKASYTITLGFDKTIFDITKSVALSVPTVVTRAQLQNPSDLFKSTGVTK